MSIRRLVFPIAAIAFFVVVAAWLWTDPRVSRGSTDELSTFNKSDKGASLAYGYLRNRPAYKAGLLTRSIAAEETSPASVVFRLSPSVEPMLSLRELQESREVSDEPLLTAPEEEWVYSGGRLVLAIADDYGPLEIVESSSTTVEKSFPIFPRVKSLQPATMRYIRGRHRGDALFLTASTPLLTRYVLGKGEVFILATPEIFSNAEIRRADHLALLDALAAGRRAYFDEVAHGIRSDAGLLELLQQWHLGPFLMLIALAFAFRFWRASTRVGAAEEHLEDRRSEAVDLVDSIGQLYERGFTRREAIEAYRESFAATVASQSMLHGAALQLRVSQLLGDGGTGVTDVEEKTGEESGARRGPRRKKDISHGEFARELERINEGFRRLDRAKHR